MAFGLGVPKEGDLELDAGVLIRHKLPKIAAKRVGVLPE